MTVPPQMPRPTPLPDASFLSACATCGAYTDCYVVSVPGSVSLAALVEAFCTTPLFRLERWVLAVLLGRPSNDLQARHVALGQSDRFAAWRVEHRAERQILLRAGRTRLWLSVATDGSSSPATSLLFGTAVVPRRPNGPLGLAFHALLGFHRVYARLLLAAAARRIAATARSANAV